MTDSLALSNVISIYSLTVHSVNYI